MFPMIPVGPMGPVEPVEPVGPVGPVNPVGPVGPITPLGPDRPVGPDRRRHGICGGKEGQGGYIGGKTFGGQDISILFYQLVFVERLDLNDISDRWLGRIG